MYRIFSGGCVSTLLPLYEAFFFNRLRWAFVCVLAMFSLATVAKSERMNVIYILTDDQRYDEIGFLNPVISTPNMDKLAQEGCSFCQ